MYLILNWIDLILANQNGPLTNEDGIIFKNIGICRVKDQLSKVIVKIQAIQSKRKALKAVINELKIIRACQHPHIIKHFAVCAEGSIVM